MNPMIKEILTTLFRALLLFVSGWCVKVGLFTAEQADKYVAWGAVGLATAVGTIGFAVWARYKNRIHFLTALTAPPGTTEKDVKDAVKSGEVKIAVTTPPDVVPVHTGNTEILTKDASKLGLLLLIGTLAFSPVVFTGCGSTKPTPQAVVYYTLADTKAAVGNAEKVYGNMVVTGKVSAGDQRDIDAKIVEFHTAYWIAVKAARANYSLKTPAEVQELADQLIAFIRFIEKE